MKKKKKHIGSEHGGEHTSVLEDRETNGADEAPESDEEAGERELGSGERGDPEPDTRQEGGQSTEDLKTRWHELAQEKARIQAELADVKEEKAQIEDALGKRLASKGSGAEATMPDGLRYRAKKEKGGSKYTLQRAPVGREVAEF